MVIQNKNEFRSIKAYQNKMTNKGKLNSNANKKKSFMILNPQENLNFSFGKKLPVMEFLQKNALIEE